MVRLPIEDKDVDQQHQDQEQGAQRFKKTRLIPGLIEFPNGREQPEEGEQICAAKKAPLYQKILRSLLKKIINISVINQTAISSQLIILCHSGVKV